MAATAKDLIDEISAQLHGYGSTADRVTPLAGDVGPTDSTFSVDFTFGQSVGIAPGVVEIDSEQLYVTNVDPTTNLITVADGFGRGYNGTTATSHSAGAKVVSRPKFPRNWLFKQVNEVIGGLYPDLFQVGSYTTTVTYPSNTYTIPTVTPLHVLDAQWQDPIGNWQECRAYKIDPYNGTFRLGGGVMIGRPLRILYAIEPTQFASETDLFSSTGLPASCSDLVIMGVVARQVVGLDISRAQLTSVEQSDRSRVVPPNAGVNASRYLMQLYLERLKNESTALRKQFRSRTVKVW